MFSKSFISAGNQFATFENPVAAPYFRKSFFPEKSELKSAKITICGLGFYELYINGTRITKGYLAPYISNPDDLIYYDQYDLLPHLDSGKNVIGILLGNGMQNAPGGKIWDFDKAVFRGAPKVALALELEYNSGEKSVIEADTSFKTASSPIYFDDLRAGEFYDARKEIKDWNLPGFDDSSWNNAVPAETPRGEAVLCNTEPIAVTKQLSPVFVYRGKISWQPNFHKDVPVISMPADEAVTEGWIYDFGVNAAGLCRLHIHGKPGQKIVLQFGELADQDGNLDLRCMTFLPQAYNQRDIFICSGNDDIYMPTFTYHGFRYCLVTGITDEQATNDLLTYCIMHSDIKQISTFNCSDETVNRLQQTVLVSDFSNFYYFPTDCPHREKNGWTADAALSTEQMLINMSCQNSLREWMRNIRKAQREDGALPGIIPTTGWGFAWGNGPGWDCVIAYIPYYLWKYRGDLQVIHENATAIVRYLNYLSMQTDDKGLLHIGLGDWCHAGRLTGCKAPLELTDTIVSIDICRKASAMFEAASLPIQKQFADTVCQALYTAARKHLIDPETMCASGNCQTSQAMAIYYDIFTDDEKPKAFDRLLQFIEEENELIDVGVLGARILFHVLSRFGRTELAYQMITTDRFPSYAYWINNGETALCESFRLLSDSPDSHNHHFFGDISSWFMQNLVGIRINPTCRDIREINIEPKFINELSFAEGSTESVYGTVSVSWKRNDKDISLNYHLPETCYGNISLEEGWHFADGSHTKCLSSGNNTLQIYRS